MKGSKQQAAEQMRRRGCLRPLLRVLPIVLVVCAPELRRCCRSQCKKWAALLMEFSARSAYSSNEAVS